MIGTNSCYRDLTGENCPGQMYGDNAPGATWEISFLRADLGPNRNFIYPPGRFFALGNGLGAPKIIGPPKPKKGGHPGGPGHNGGPPGPPIKPGR
jgi:hypothetical protein